MRALTRVATPENEAELVEIGVAATASQCERICRTFRKVMAPRGGADAEVARRVSVREGDDGTVRVSVVLPADEGARFVAGMDAAKVLLDRKAPRGEAGDSKARHSRADRLMAMVEGWFSAEPRSRRGGAPNEVVLHVTPDALRAGEGGGDSAETPSPPPGRCGHAGEVSDGFAYLDNLGGAGVSRETARRLACDASLVPICTTSVRPRWGTSSCCAVITTPSCTSTAGVWR